MKQVYTTTSLPEAHALCAMLKAHGIEAVVENEGGAFYAVGMPSPALPLCISVPDEKAEEAARILAENRDSEPPTPEDAAFAERVRRSGEISRRAWRAYAWIFLLSPVLLVPIVALRDPAQAHIPISMALAYLGVPLLIALAARRHRRPSPRPKGRADSP